MGQPWHYLRGCVAAVALAGWAGAAHASDPLPGDLVAPPTNVNIAMVYNIFTTADEYDEVGGAKIGGGTHLADDALVGRYIRTVAIGGFTAGVQGYIPYGIFAGSQILGVPEIPGPAPGFPGFGPGQARLTSHDGFGQPNLSAFIYPIDLPASGTYAVISPWVSPPVGNFNKAYSLNPATEGVWTYEIEDGVRTTLLGSPTGPNLAIELWDTLYFYGANKKAALVSPEIDADSIPPLYQALGVTNPLQRQSALPATYRQQPSNELRVYLPIEIVPATRGFIAPGLYQSFGGKATYKIGGRVLDAGSRTNETQLRLVASSFVSRSVAVTLAGYFDVRARGGPLERTLLFRLVTFF